MNTLGRSSIFQDSQHNLLRWHVSNFLYWFEWIMSLYFIKLEVGWFQHGCWIKFFTTIKKQYLSNYQIKWRNESFHLSTYFSMQIGSNWYWFVVNVFLPFSTRDFLSWWGFAPYLFTFTTLWNVLSTTQYEGYVLFLPCLTWSDKRHLKKYFTQPYPSLNLNLWITCS